MSTGSLPTPPGTHVLRCGEVELEIMEHGAAIRRLVVPTATGPRNVVLAYASIADYVAAADFMGTSVGRYANRIAGAAFELDGLHHELAANENGNQLHGGPDGYFARTWQVLHADEASIRLGLNSPDGDQGFPGNLDVSVRFSVRADGIDMDYAAVTDAPTVVNLTNHAYFNLNGEGIGTIQNHVLMVPAGQYTPVGAGLIPTAEIESVAGSALDLREGRSLAEVLASDDEVLKLAGGLDHNLIPDGEGLRLHASLDVADLRMDLLSDAPGLQVYTGNYLGGAVAQGESVTISGGRYPQYGGMCLEPQAFPDTPNQPQFGSARLDPGQEYRRRIQLRFAAI